MTNITVEILTKDYYDQMIVTKTVVEKCVYTLNRNRMGDGIPLGICSCIDDAFTGLTYETGLTLGLEALISVGIIGRPLVTYCVDNHTEVTYEKTDRHAEGHGEGNGDRPRVKETAYICTNHNPPVVLAVVTPKRAWCCHEKLLDHISSQNPSVSVKLTRPTTDGLGRRVHPSPLTVERVVD